MPQWVKFNLTAVAFSFSFVDTINGLHVFSSISV